VQIIWDVSKVYRCHNPPPI